MLRVLIAGVQPPPARWDAISLRFMWQLQRPVWLGELSLHIGFGLKQTLQVLERLRDQHEVERLPGESELWQLCNPRLNRGMLDP